MMLPRVPLQAPSWACLADEAVSGVGFGAAAQGH